MSCRISIPSYASPYNLPLRPRPYVPGCSAQPPGSIYVTDWGTFGNCTARGARNGMAPFDFICPRGRMCTSQTSANVGQTPDEVCCGGQWYQQTVHGPVREVQNIWGPLE